MRKIEKIIPKNNNKLFRKNFEKINPLNLFKIQKDKKTITNNNSYVNQKKIEKPLLLPIKKSVLLLAQPPISFGQYPIQIRQVSGLAMLDDYFFKTPYILNETIRFCFQLIANVLYFIYTNDHIKENPIDQIANILAIPGNLKKSQILEKYGPIIQHALSYLTSFTKKPLKQFLINEYPEITFDTHDKYVNYNNILEIAFFSKAISLKTFRHLNY